jgi:hypothetical protein
VLNEELRAAIEMYDENVNLSVICASAIKGLLG